MSRQSNRTVQPERSGQVSVGFYVDPRLRAEFRRIVKEEEGLSTSAALRRYMTRRVYHNNNGGGG